MANPTLKRKASTQAGADKNNKKAKSDSHKQQHTAKHDRKSQNRHSDMITEAKKIWETLRRGDISREETKQLMDQIMGVIKGHVQEIIFKHDASRIIQTCLKKGNSEQKNEIAGELTGKYLDLSKSMYGKFIALKALEYCPKQRDQILSEFRTHIRKLIRHKEASTVVEAFFAQFSNAAQRRELLAEFYGPEMTLFNRGGGAKTLDELLKNLPEKKDTVLKFMAETLTGCMDKGTVVHSIVHTALYQYLTLADDKARQDMFAHLRDNVQDILHTREGSKVAIMLVSYASPKDRKHIVKNFKPYLTKIAEDQYGYLVLLRLLDVTDDTVLINKAVVSELLKHAQKLFNDKYGRRIFLYILAGRNTKYLSPETVKQLKEADAYRNSKKDPEIRSKEILEGSSPLLIQAVAQHASTLLRESLSSQIVRETMLHAVGDKSAAIDAILDLAGESIEKDNHIMENPFANRVIKAMVKADTAEEANDRATEPLNFAPKLLERIKTNLAHFATNYGSFVVVALLEEPSTKDEVAALLKPHKKEIKKAKEQNTAPGAQILLELL